MNRLENLMNENNEEKPEDDKDKLEKLEGIAKALETGLKEQDADAVKKLVQAAIDEAPMLIAQTQFAMAVDKLVVAHCKDRISLLMAINVLCLIALKAAQAAFPDDDSKAIAAISEAVNGGVDFISRLGPEALALDPQPEKPDGGE